MVFLTKICTLHYLLWQQKNSNLFSLLVYILRYQHILQIHAETEDRTRELRTEIKREREKMEAVVAAKPIIKVAALCGSLRKASYNRGLVRSGTFVFSVFYFVFRSWVLISLCVWL